MIVPVCTFMCCQLTCDYGNTFPKPEVTWVTSPEVDSNEETPVLLNSRVQIDLEGDLHFMNVETVSTK